MSVPFKEIATWRERIGQTAEFPLHLATDVERAMVAEIADLRASNEGRTRAQGWTDTATALPEDEVLVLLALNDDDVWPGYRYCDVWRYVDAMPITTERVTHWMPFAPAPQLEQSEAGNG